jgi:hypothetical protein
MSRELVFRHGSDNFSLLCADGDSVEALRFKVAEERGLDPSTVKFIAKGKLLANETVIGSALDVVTTKITVVGSSLILAQPEDVKIAVKDDLSATRVKRKFAVSAKHGGRSRSVISPYRFHAIQTLPGFKDEARARQILEELSNDPAILYVLEKHRWSVGSLCEMYPEGQVGVSDVCVMGLNLNKGQKILLRLRTDDLKGFRKILSIRKVLFHELSHNEHSEHDDDFYVLMRQIEREVNDADWSRGSGRALDPSFERFEGSSSSRVASEGGVHILGGSNAAIPHTLVQPRVLAAIAATQRISAEEKEVEDACGAANGHRSAEAVSCSTDAQRNTSAEHRKDRLLATPKEADPDQSHSDESNNSPVDMSVSHATTAVETPNSLVGKTEFVIEDESPGETLKVSIIVPVN